ncbi:MAG: twin-arginine translocase subunit TatC [Phascolarctobacterium sp.]|nr:twin-arginine translocase subunit TatC [Phascolarctobacterium sp.]
MDGMDVKLKVEPWRENIDRDMSLAEHLTELRSCLVKAGAALVAGTAVSFYYLEYIIKTLTAPVGQLYYLRPAEAFMVYLKIALLAGLILASPMVLYQLYSFVRPALTLREKHYALCTIPIIIVLFLGGMLFSYYLVFPRAVEFFLGFGPERVSPLISIESYLDFMLMLVVPFGFVFNIPVVLLLLVYVKLVSAQTLNKYQKHVILAAFILAALITPTPDIFTQSLLALPMVVLYEVSLVLCKLLLAS